MRYRQFWLWTLLCMSLSSLYAQEGERVQGVILEENANGALSPLEFVNVFWHGTSSGTFTDSTGYFELEMTDPTNRRLIVSYVGYAPDTIIIADKYYLSVVLSNTNTLQEVEVVYRKRTTEVSFLDPLLVESISQGELFKAACCNLSESFETNASVDVSVSDAITGAREIQMLGLSGKYTMISQENMPGIRGLAIPYGLLYTPGTWIQSMQITKGAGSVVQGYESMAGQINVELQKPEDNTPLFLNAYVNEAQRLEFNATSSLPVSNKLSTAILAHASTYPKVFDRNDDSFADQPEGSLFTLANRWKFNNQKAVRAQLGIKYTRDDKTGGQVSYVDGEFPGAYGVERLAERLDVWGKMGFIFPQKRYQSIGFQWSVNQHDQVMTFGNRSYDGQQTTAYANLIFQSIIGSSFHKFKVGASLMYDQYDEQWSFGQIDKTETVPGAFLEYTYAPGDQFSAVVGMRVDHNSLYGTLMTPRAHMRYALGEQSVLRFSAGRGFRSANPIAENLSLLATSRDIIVGGDKPGVPYGLELESSWNIGGSFMQEFLLDFRPGRVVVDFFHTAFQDQVIVDLDVNPQLAVIRNLDGKSYSSSFQIEASYELFKRTDIKLAYRLMDVKTTFEAGLLEVPLVAKQRGFANVAYSTIRRPAGHWTFDATLQLTGQQRLPGTASNPEGLQRPDYSESYATVHAQVTRYIGRDLSIYLGAENLTNFRQDDPIIAADDPFGDFFDSSMVWGPIFGRKVYLGVRYMIAKSEEE